MVRDGDGCLELAFGSGVIVLLFCCQSTDAMGGLRELRLSTACKGERFIDSAADDRWCADVILAEIVDGVIVLGIELDGGFEGCSHFGSEFVAGKRTGAVGLEAVDTAHPVLRLAVIGLRGKSGFALCDRAVGELFGVEGATEKQVGASVLWIGCDEGLKAGDGVVRMALQQHLFAFGKGVGRRVLWNAIRMSSAGNHQPGEKKNEREQA